MRLNQIPFRAGIPFWLLACALPAGAQDGFGSAVAVSGNEVIALKPHTSQGFAALIVFRNEGGAWRAVDRLHPIERAGEGFGWSMALAGNLLLVAAADPSASWGAHVYHRAGGRWSPVGRIPWSRGATAATASEGGPVRGFAELAAFAQPPPRVVALAPDGSTAAIARTGKGPPEVVVVRRGAAAADWTEEARFVPDSAAERLELALAADRLVVALADREGSAVVIVYAREPNGRWSILTTIRPPVQLAEGARFGAPVAIDHERIILGMPHAGTVLTYDLSASGDHPPRQILRAADADTSLFGASLAFEDNELWVGAPLAQSATGAVHRFVRDARDSPWRAAGPPPDDGGESPGYFGAALALAGERAVVGAMGSGSRGALSVWTRSADDGWIRAGSIHAAPEQTSRTGAVVRCSGGDAAGFECANVDLHAFLTIPDLGGSPGEMVTEVWGWTDSITGREYALVGRTGGVAIVDVTESTAPRYLGVVPGPHASARGIKVHRDHMFFVGEMAGDHGMLVFDLKRLREVAAGTTPAVFQPDARYGGIASAHNLVMDAESGTAIAVGSSSGGNTCGGGLHMADVSNPLDPVFAGCYTDTEGLIWQGRTHDAQCTRYRGPDEAYRGRNVCFVSNETALSIVDITQRSAPRPISKGHYPDRGYVHQGWLTDDHRYFFMNDEGDEAFGLTLLTRTLIWDVSDLDDPILAGEFHGPDGATDHNLFIRGNLMYLANYQAGLRIVDISDPLYPVEIGFFDTTPFVGNPPGWNGGAWNPWPFFVSGTILVSSMHEGLFLLRPRPTAN